MPLLIIVLFGFVELGRALLQANTLTQAVTTGVRYLSRVPNAVTAQPHCDPGATWGAAVAQAELLIENTNAGAGSVILPGLNSAGAITFSRRPELLGLGGATEVRACVVRVEASAQFVPLSGNSLVPFFQVGPIILNAQAEERYIGE